MGPWLALQSAIGGGRRSLLHLVVTRDLLGNLSVNGLFVFCFVFLFGFKYLWKNKNLFLNFILNFLILWTNFSFCGFGLKVNCHSLVMKGCVFSKEDKLYTSKLAIIWLEWNERNWKDRKIYLKTLFYIFFMNH